ncbi:MAG: elongation factor Tu [Bacteroidia bacterium]|nr:elongation factor Tu [Bacteroidia bacterium]
MAIINGKPDFIARLNYLTYEEGGRSIPTSSGYRPQVKFDFSELLTGGQQMFIDKELVYPGESVMAEILLVSTDFARFKLVVGSKFEFREGARTIGHGEIIEILNPILIEKTE